MKDYKDNATMELPGLNEPMPENSDHKKSQANSKRGKVMKQVQLDLLADLGPTDISGLPAWVKDENLDLTGLPVWR
ncbi:hypothetical protein [Undibacterium rugosum]|uniref:Uncharacterized protein n=1 Tax=Undibacterium rugosum TaxID=2762291 RepID=A0A923KZL5_9BURK|nr:hypothetical protein [Undibacterium rugosum]MBC3936288.1 hypothetical protein [Undibacterium rugosum]MBR7777355.1 hypothetical protein [Undibacterium rugosum]